MANKLKVGPWHPGNTWPVHVGEYETRLLGPNAPISRAYWNGRAWKWMENASGTCVFQNRRWRGVLK